MAGNRALTVWLPSALGVVLFLMGTLGLLSEGWAWAIFMLSVPFLGLSVAFIAVFVFTDFYDTGGLIGGFKRFGLIGTWLYVLGIAALAGVYFLETIEGRMEVKWIIFGPLAVAVLVVLDVGVYRKVFKPNAISFARWRRFLSREQAETGAARSTLVDEVILHRTLFSISRFRWLKHTLIFWGFSLMFATELVAMFFRDAMPSFGLPRFWQDLDHPVRLALDLLYEVSGVMVLVGCLLALIWRVIVQGTEEQKYTDSPTALFLFVVVVSGFTVEGLRLSAVAPQPFMDLSFVGAYLAGFWRGDGAILYDAYYEPLWLAHVVLSCLLLAYLPLRRFIHIFATPVGRIMNSQARLLEARKEGVVEGMLQGKEMEGDRMIGGYHD